ncbi:Hypothetical protein CINCED_3A018303 [Cinara cedri]|nr:Hypothetical protein CINCED_3A018303 [Cinara cedri]
MHSIIITKEFYYFKVIILPALTDNYMYLIIDKKSKEAAIVDPVEPNVVWDAVRKENVKLTTVLTTHHHWDHAGGNKELLNSNTGGELTVIGGDDRIDGLTKMITPHETDYKLGSLCIKCIRTPCHTTGHVCYYIKKDNDMACFTGDTLFFGGCGRFFEGNAKQMYDALINVISEFPDGTSVFCGHEYAVQNLKFGLFVEPSNQNILSALNNTEFKRQIKKPSVPSTVGLEKLINPFMRVKKKEVQIFTQTIGDPIETMRVLREMKNNF